MIADNIITLQYLLNEEDFKRLVAGKEWFTNYGMCPLHTAVFLGRDEMLRMMVEAGISINSYSVDVDGFTIWTPLHCAIFHGKTSTSNLLLDLGADANILTKSLTATAFN